MELQDILEKNDFKHLMVTGGNLGNKPSRNDIEMVLIENGFTDPLANEVSFSMVDINEKMFNVTYYPSIDRYGYEKLTVK